MPVSRTRPFAERLLAWWDRHGRRDLPWQHPRTPYRVWVSEIMLQQTQVVTVIPYFQRWMTDFPDLQTLAAATVDDVLSHWSGLGYYARARHLHQAAKQCMEQFGGDLPAEAAALRSLPGIGQSTANAIVSLSTDRPAAVLDGNVRRVLARHAAVEGWPGKASVSKRLWAEAEVRLPGKRGADYTQAIMDLGAIVCVRSRPRCGECPVNADCQALTAGAVDRFPATRLPTRVSRRSLHMLILRDRAGRVLLEKRPPAGIWGGLWCLPEGDDLAGIEARLGLAAVSPAALPDLEHRLSHLLLQIQPFLADAAEATQVQCPASHDWFAAEQWPRLGMPGPITKLLNRLHNGEFD